MQKHTQVYFTFFGYGMDDFVACELCGSRASGIHHIIKQSKFTRKDQRKNRIENLMAVCNTCHEKCEHQQIKTGQQVQAHWIKLKGKINLTLPELCSILAALKDGP